MSKVVLLADDSPDDELLFKRVLKSAGVDNPVRVVRDGGQVIEYLKGEGTFADRQLFPLPAVLFLDLFMPRVDGWEVLRWLQTAQSKWNLRVVVLTGPTQRALLQDAYNLGAHSFLFKPFNKEELEGLIQYWPEIWTLSKAGSPMPPLPPLPPMEGDSMQPD